MPLTHYSIRVFGAVQGVGFRYSTLREAGRLGITGTVRNDDEGSVSIEAEGGRQALDRFRDWCRRGPVGAVVTDLTCAEKPVRGYASFEIAS
jgi:acylphosphatase